MTPQSPAPVAGRPLTAEDVAELKRLAEAATPGPWKACGTIYEHMNCEVRSGRKGEGQAIAQVWDGPNAFKDGQWIAAASPAAFLALIAENERLSRPASEQPVEALGAGREEGDYTMALAERQAFENHPDLAAHIERMAMSGRLGSHIEWDGFLREMNAALSPASPARSPMGERGDLREALECVEDYDHTGRLAGVLRQAIDGAVRIDHLTPDQQSDIRAHVTGLSDPEEETYEAPEHGWTCFHCGATFKTTRGARMHFGHNVTGRPKCHDPERLVEIYDGAQAAVAAASPAWVDFEVRVARRDEARNAIIAALSPASPARSPMGETDTLVDRFADALKSKLRAAGEKYGFDDAWKQDDWREKLIEDLWRHVQKGDPRDVAAYCAFAWHHSWSLAAPTPMGGEVEALREALMAAQSFIADGGLAESAPGASIYRQITQALEAK